MDQLRLTPVIETRSLRRPLPWAPPRRQEGWIALSGDADDDRVVEALAALVNGNPVEPGETVETALEALMAAECVIAPGGLRAAAGAFEILPSCCCGLEGWREWFGVKPGGQSPWLGHDPGPWVDCGPDAATLWSDENGDSLTVSYEALGTALNGAALDMEGFVDRLSDWLARHAPARAEFAPFFAEAFGVYGDRPDRSMTVLVL